MPLLCYFAGIDTTKFTIVAHALKMITKYPKYQDQLCFLWQMAVGLLDVDQPKEVH